MISERGFSEIEVLKSIKDFKLRPEAFGSKDSMMVGSGSPTPGKDFTTIASEPKIPEEIRPIPTKPNIEA